MGLNHPLLVLYMTRYRSLPPTEVGIRVRSNDRRAGVLSIWYVTTQSERGGTRTTVLPLAVDNQGQRTPAWERKADQLFHLPPASHATPPKTELLTEVLEPMILRELQHRGFISENAGYNARLIGWVEVG